jgi:hypothetical protein
MLGDPPLIVLETMNVVFFASEHSLSNKRIWCLHHPL